MRIPVPIYWTLTLKIVCWRMFGEPMTGRSINTILIMDTEYIQPPGRILSDWVGDILRKKRSGDPYCLALGEFLCGKENRFGANFSVDWGDGGETTEVMFRFENVYGDRTRYLEANGIPAVPPPLDANRTPLQTGDIPPVCYWDRYLFINVKR